MTNSRRKGHDFERRVANSMREELGEVVKEDVKRILDQAREAELGDIEIHDFVIECKRYSPLPTYREQWWDQVWASAKKTKKHPILVYKFDRQDIQAVLPLYLIGGGWSARKEYRADVSFANMYAIMRNYISGSHFERFPFQEAVAPNEDVYQGMFFNNKSDKYMRDESDEKNPLVFTPTSTL